MKKIRQISSAILLMMASSVAFSQSDLVGDKAAGEASFFTCIGCHNNTGIKNAYPSYSVPKLAGQREEYINTALHAYKNGERSHPTMQGNASSLSDQDIANIATYLSTLSL